ncbi:MAG: protease HtpX [Verrucomicrobia bacterium]|nr:protease HtpX [Verrucomicrobiota bacterium]MBS0636483.1 protease HtpX [Verrucomicrobiota bacterium]
MGAIAKRIILFIAVNALVLVTISLILNFFNVKPYLTPYGLDYNSLMIFCLIWGMAGAFISLGLSRIMAKWMMGVQVIDPARATGQERALVDMVYKLAKNAGLSGMPEVGIYSSPEVNAFATGPTQKRSLVAVSSGLLNRMNSAEVEAVLAHEVSHVANGDMVTMTLLQGVVNAFVMFFARVLAYAVMRMGRSKDDESVGSPFMYSILVFLFEIVFMILGTIVIATYSRFREYRADAGGARLVGRDKMIAALEALGRTVQIQDPKAEQPAFQSMKISSGKPLMRLFSSHPPLEDRIARLQNG